MLTFPKTFSRYISNLSILPPTPTQMASYNYSTSSSELGSPHTPRSSSPSSVASRSSSTTISKRISISTSRRNTGMNPLGGIDIAAIEAAMKQSSLDHLRGYAQDHFGTIKQYSTTEYVPKSAAGGYQVLREPAWNKGEISP
jgi:malate dehydrogenase (oxaloacetate-decarboxylating)(NADP+)